MSAVRRVRVEPGESDLRLDRWFRRRFPKVSHVRLQKLLRTGQVRVDGRRAKAADRLVAGQEIRIPPLGEAPVQPKGPADPRPISARDAAALEARILFIDDHVIAIDKPAGLAVQGGTGTLRHLDAMLDALRLGAHDRPRLVHRLDRDTSGVLLLARNAAAAERLGKAFRGRDAHKLYWAVTVGVPKPAAGRISLPLAKLGGRGAERVAPDVEEGKPAVTDYRLLEAAGKRLAWLALAPRTGRTHQLRAHMAALGTPILGDGKYGGAQAHLSGLAIAKRLHLHARRIALPHPSGRGEVRVEAPLPPHMSETFAEFGFDPREHEHDLLEGGGRLTAAQAT